MLVVFSASHKDYERCLAQLEWCCQLGRYHHHNALIVCSLTLTEDQIKELVTMAQASGFDNVTAIKLREEDDRGWPSACNAMFRAAGHYARDVAHRPFFWCESDCIPIREHWLDAIEDEYKKCGKLFMGHVWDKPWRHMTGNGVYPANLSKYNPHILTETKMPWDVTHAELTLPFIHHTNLIQHVWGDVEKNIAPTFPDRESLAQLSDDAVVFHRNKDGTLIQRLREERHAEFPMQAKQKIGGLRGLLNMWLNPKRFIVVWPFFVGDGAMAIKNLKWIAELGPYPFDIVLSYDDKTPVWMIEESRELAKAAFENVIEHTYPSPERGVWKPNVAFRESAMFMQSLGRPWLWMEYDAVPLRANWLDVLQHHYWRCGKAFAGPVIPGRGHMNGTGIYPPDTPKRIPKTMQTYNLAWDLSMKSEMIKDCHDLYPFYFHAWGVLGGKLSPHSGPSPTFPTLDSLKLIPKDAVIFHRCKDGTLIDRLREGKATGIMPEETDRVRPVANVSIFICTYRRDFTYLKYCLRSIEKFASQFKEVRIVVPKADLSELKSFAGNPPDPMGIPVVCVGGDEWPGKGMLWHEHEICFADHHCDAEYVLHIDPDCIFIQPVTPDTFFVDGKPVLQYESYERLGKRHPSILNWKKCTEACLPFPVEYETMRGHPEVYHIGVYERTRELIEKKTGTSFSKYLQAQRNEYPQSFAEFPTLGAVAMHEFPDLYHLVDMGAPGKQTGWPCVIQFWSNGPIDKAQNIWIESVQQKVVPMDIISKHGLA